MASSFADRPFLPPADADGQNDPFVSPTAPTHHRYSNFDSQLFALSPTSSPGQAKRALEAHLAETERRMAEAGKLGTALVQQQKELRERLKDVEQLQAEGELTPELRVKLSEIEKEYNDVAKETARAFLPKQRIPSNETAGGSPYVPEGRGGRRSVSPSKFESQATGSPTKLSVPNRKIRNQPTNRVHDIEFAAEISTSLLAQVRNLQALLAEKDEEMRDIKAENSRLEVEAEGFQQRVKTLDESEHRYKDENWNLETQIHELIANQKESADREKKLSQSVNIFQAEKNQAQKELDETKLSHAKLLEEHEAMVKAHDIELGTAKRGAALAETERSTLQKKIDDLTNQNQELARAFSSQRGRALERDANSGMSDEDFQTAADDVTPEHSPPPSPVKFTPRHSMLESETLKTSLLHAQRTIQSQRSQLHREKTEKLELKRMLQDSRDELERARSDSGGLGSRRSRKVDSKEFKKTSRGLLGSLRTAKSEVFLDDPDWEEHDGGSPRTSPTHSTPTARKPTIGEYPQTTDTSDQFDTANETSDAAFETANERGTETEDFQTGAEEFSDDDVQTETESPSRARSRRPHPLMLAGNRNSFHSTASTSGDEDFDFNELQTPLAHHQPKVHLKLSRGLLNRRSRQPSEEPAFQSSPASFVSGSAASTPQQGGQSLFAELAELEGSDDESVNTNTPSRSRRSMTPASVISRRTGSIPAVPPLPNMAMVDSGIMTDPVKRDAAALEIPGAGPVRPAMVDSGTMTEPLEAYLQSPTSTERPRTMESVIAPGVAFPEHDESPSRPLSAYSDAGSQHDPDMTRSLAQFPVPPTMQKAMEVPAAPVLGYAALDQLIIDPVAEPEVVPVPPTLSFVAVDSQQVEPVSEPEVPPPPPIVLGLSSVLSEDVEPVAEPEPPVPVLGFSSVVSELVEPIAEPVFTPEPLVLGLSPLLSESLEPKAEPAIEPPSLSLSPVVFEAVEPIAEPEIEIPAPPSLSMSAVVFESVEPIAEPAIELPAPPAPPSLSLSTFVSEAVEPVIEPEVLPAVIPAPALSFIPLMSEEVEPRAEPEAPMVLPPALSISPLWEHNIEPFAELAVQPVVPVLSFSSLASEGVEPVAEPVVEPVVPTLGFSSVLSEGVEPLAEPIVVPNLAFSSLVSEGVEPLAEPVVEPVVPTLNFSTLLSEGVEPIQEPAPEAPAPIALTLSTIQSEGVEPISEPEPIPAALGFSYINSWDVEPRADPVPLLPALSLSSITHEEVKPIAPPTPPTVAPTRFAFSSIDSIETRPITPRSPWRDGFILPRDAEIPMIESSPPRTPDHNLFGTALGRNKSSRRAPIEPVIAEDETRQSPSGAREPDTPESQRPFKEISTNADSRPARKPSVSMADQGAQTSLTADAIDQMLMAKARGHEKNMSIDSSVGSPGTVRIRRLSHGQDSPAFSREASVEPHNDSIFSQRPGSAASSAAPTQPLPPLPPNHKEKIEAARTGSSHGTQAPGTVMGPPLWPASAMRNQRPRTPSLVRNQSPSPIKISTSTPRATRTNSITPGTAVIHSPTKASARSRRSSISSFASEVDMRFGNRNMGFEGAGFGPNTDPRMIQAITQTMIGEYLWKYTRKAGRGEMSENRHRRYFWVHPYTRTLYWSERDPSAADRSTLKAKSVPIEAVRVVTDDNPMPPGLHRKSLIVISPGRAIKFTCTTGQRHETWFNALSYLLLRTNDEGQNDAEEMVGNLTQADVDEFNPQIGRERVTAGNRPVAPQSLSSYNSRTTRNSPALDMSMEIPTLTPTPGKSNPPQRPSIGTLGRLSGYWKNSQVLSGTFSSFRGRSTSGQAGNSIYEASEVHDSAEDVREMIERQDREADRLENVRACCDGKHDVGSLHHHSVSKRHRPSLGRSNAGSSTTPMSTMKSRA